MKAAIIGTIVLFFGSAIAQEQPAYLLHYQSSSFVGCIKAIEDDILPKRKLRATEQLIYAECLFQAKRLGQAAVQFDEILLAQKENLLRSANRLLDIYKAGQTDIPLGNLVSFLKRERQAEFIAMQMQPLFIENHNIKGFLELYNQYPLHLNHQQWSVLTASLSEKQFATVIAGGRLSPRNQQLKWAEFWLTQGKTGKALEILDAILKKGTDIHALKLKASIQWQQGEHNQADTTLAALKDQGIRGYRELAAFYFENGRPKRALKVTREGITRDYSLHDVEVFYMMALGELVESAYLLEKYMRSAKMARFRYHNIQQDYFREGTNGTNKQYWQGMQKLVKEKPDVCGDAVKYQYQWDTPTNLKKSIASCKVLKQSARWQSFLFLLDTRKKYNLIVHLLSDRKEHTPKESLLLGKSHLLGQPVESGKAISVLSPLAADKAFPYKNELKYYLGKAYLNVGKYAKAELMVSSIVYSDSVLLWLSSLIYQERWDEMQLVLRTEPMKKHIIEKKYYEAVWSLAKGQSKQGEMLLETYLQDAGRFGNQAVYILFLLKYFQKSEQVSALAKVLIKYPSGLGTADWKTFEKTLDENAGSEFDAFVHYWHARYLLLNDQVNDGKSILLALRKSKHASLLYADIDFLLIEHGGSKKKGARAYLLKFPDSPFRILLKP